MTDASLHLSLDELVALAGQPETRPEPSHLEHCTDCRAELDRWRSVARGVRAAAPAEPRPEVLRGVLAAVDAQRPKARRGRRAVLLSAVGAPRLAVRRGRHAVLPSARGARRPAARGGRRAVVLAALAAAVVGAATYGLWPGDGPAGSPRATGTFSAQQVASMGLLATECKDLKVAAGTLRSVNGTRLVVATAKGKTVEVDASASPKVTRQVPGRVSDLADGATVLVRGDGDRAGTSVTAHTVVIGSAAMKLPKLLGGPQLDITSMMAASGTALGTVRGAGADGFTVTGSDGTRVRVATPASTKVIKQERARPDQLETGRYTVVVGTLEKDGTLRATTVQQDTLTNGVRPSLPNGFKTPEGLASGGPQNLPDPPGMLGGTGNRLKDLFSGLGCDTDAIANAAVNGTAL
jgi:hypothetical protein